MNKLNGIILTLGLWLVLCGTATATQLYVNDSGWWQEGGAFNANDTLIQAAVDAANVGDSIYVHGGNYYENVNVYKRLTLEGEGADVVVVTAADPGDHVFEVTADYVNISGFAVRGATDSVRVAFESVYMAGVYLNNADYCNIYGNDAYGSGYGIFLSSSSNNTLADNIANSNAHGGIYLSSSSSNKLTNNTANSSTNSNNNNGITLYYSSNNNITDNTANSNNHGIRLYDSNSNTLTSNIASSNNYYGITLSSSSNNTLTNNTANSNHCAGIDLSSSSNNTLTNNTANSNNWNGIVLWYLSNYNKLANNTANSNSDYDGIWLSSSNSNTLTGNTVNSNNNGIHLDNVGDNDITCNLVQDNAHYGFYLTSGNTGNNISYNNIIENGNYDATIGGWEWQFHIDQYQHVEAKHNYWGDGMNNDTIDASVYDDEEGWGEVEFYPFETEPVQCPLTPETPAFTTADAVITLQIAVGSRPPDPRYDVSGDNRVTSLDALMILQAVADAIEL